jgi:dipeptidyl aminopeptidase/acylaminoacyl peptidase
VDLEGRERVLLDSPGSLTIWDAAPDGRALITRDDERMSVIGMAPGATQERDLSVFDTAGLAALSADGAQLLFGDRYGVYLRKTDGSPPIKLGVKDVYPDDLSPDGKSVVATSANRDRLIVFPVGPGDVRTLPAQGIEAYTTPRWFPDGHRILFSTWERSAADRKAGVQGQLRTYVTDRSGSAPIPLTPPGIGALALSPDGRRLAVKAGPGIAVWPVGGDRGEPVPGSLPEDRPVGWSEDGRSLWVFQRGRIPADVHRLDLGGGGRHLWKRLVPPDPAGVYSINDVRITPRGDAYFYSYRRILSELYLAAAPE